MPWVTSGGGPYNHGEADATPIITYWKPDKVKVSKYTPPTDPVSIIGIVVGSATLVQCVYDNATGLSATLTQTTFDTTTRADSAEILLTNATGTAKVVRGAEIRAKTITMLSGSEGYLNDKYVDYESISNNGEIKLEIGNNFIVTFAQVNQLADYHWKNSRMKRHLYTLSLTGCQSFFEPGEWYTALIGAVGTSEYIGGVGGTTVMCYNVRSSIAAGGIGSTQVTFLEMYPGWGFDSNELARSIASGQFNRAPTGLTATVASSTYMGTADFYCDGTADEVEINNAITYMAGKGGGTVQLTEGTFNVAAAVALKNNTALYLSGTTIEKNGNYHAVECIGTSGTHISKVAISGKGTITRNAADTNHVDLVHFEYVDDFSVAETTIDDGHEHGLYIVNCTNGKVEGTVKILDCAGTGLKIIASTVVLALGITITGCGIGYECWPSIDTDKIDNGTCESTEEPMLTGETVPLLSGTNLTWARSNTYAYAGTYSYKMSGGSSGTKIVYFTDTADTNDLHGLTAGKTYQFSMRMYVHSTTGVALTTSLGVIYQYYDGGAWHGVDGTAGCRIRKDLVSGVIYDEWDSVNCQLTIPASATGFKFGIEEIIGIADVNPCDVYLDNVCLYEFDATDSGCQLSNSSVSDCTDTGVIVANSHALIQNNQITGNTNKGLVIAAGYRNIVSNNRCYNNGADTGVANTNGDNFYDAGIDTQLG